MHVHHVGHGITLPTVRRIPICIHRNVYDVGAESHSNELRRYGALPWSMTVAALIKREVVDQIARGRKSGACVQIVAMVYRTESFSRGTGKQVEREAASGDGVWKCCSKSP